jgi:glycosyltransferase involved in cell wall biosynthesis
MLESIMRWLARRGHECRVNVPGEEYVHNGVRVSPSVHALDGCDVIFTHLDRTNEAEHLCEHIPLAHLIHNESTLEMFRVKKRDLVVHNTRWIAEKVPALTSVVVHPPIFEADYLCKPGRCITLINLNEMKGAPLFWALAERMSDMRFLGVLGGYGAQDVRSLPNVEVMAQVSDMRAVYSRTRVLLMPSQYESYGRCAIEAAVSGIPTIATPTPGLLEALDDAGTFPAERTVDAWESAIRSMKWPERSRAARARYLSLDFEGELLRLEDALYRLVKR